MTVKLPSSGAEGGGTSPAAPQAGTSGGANWHVHTCEGQRFGPITKEELDRWVAENRLTSSCQVYQDGWPSWRMAPEIYQNLPAAPGGTAGASNFGSAAGGTASTNPYAAPMHGGGASPSTSYQIPHRGGLILALGIIGLVLCCVCAPFAWAMGQSDLRRIRAGEMDPMGLGLTQAGMILGIIGCVLGLLQLLWVMFVLTAVVSGGF
jgi:hypothetical protein